MLPCSPLHRACKNEFLRGNLLILGLVHLIVSLDGVRAAGVQLSASHRLRTSSVTTLCRELLGSSSGPQARHILCHLVSSFLARERDSRLVRPLAS